MNEARAGQPIDQSAAARAGVSSARRHGRQASWWSAAGFLAAVGLAAVVLRSPEEPTPSTDGATERDAASRTIASAAARIAEESADRVRRPVVQAAPLPAAADPLRRDEAGAQGELPAPYAVVGFAGEMARAPMVDSGRAGEPGDAGLDWLESATPVDDLAAQALAAGRGWTFGWLRLGADARAADLAAPLRELDAEIVGAAGHLLRVRLPADEARLAAVAGLPGVDGLGAMPVGAKLGAFDDPHSEQRLDPVPVFVTLMEDDADGRWRRELTARGAVIGRYDADIRVYAAAVARAGLEALAALDFVLAVEPIGIVRPAHDTAVPAMGADALRMHGGAPGVFTGIGGAGVPVGVMDTGLNVNHPDIAEHRRSICGTNFVWRSPGLNDADLWTDGRGHGTHVTGTLAGNGYLAPRFAGTAPAVRDIRVAKVLGPDGIGDVDSVLRGTEFLAEASGCGGSETVRPLIVNMSLSASSRFFDGRDVPARKLDATVWRHRQLYVVAQANEGERGFSNYAAAKNSLSVGAVHDDGHVAAFSSWGPTYDGRLAPHVVGAGVDVCSAEGDGKGAGYVCASGTSTAAPAVAGVAALLIDARADHGGRPALARARLMASAVRPDAWLANAEAFPSTNSAGPGSLQARYGLGRVSARIAALDRDRPDGWRGGAALADVADESEYAYADIVVPEGASRLDVVMTWDEPPTEAIATPVLNDLDLWLDRNADCADGPCGEESSVSRIDNVEWIVLRDPEPGTYRAKVVPRRIYTAAPRAAVAWTVIRGSSTPELTMTVEDTLLEESGGERSSEVGVEISADAYVAAGVRLHLECRGEDADCGALTVAGATAAREDGLSAPVSEVGLSRRNERRSPIRMARGISLGEVAVDETQAVALDVVYAGSNPVHLYLTASAWNGRGVSRAIAIAPPGAGTDDNAGDPADMPANDGFADAEPLAAGEGSLPVDPVGSTSEAGEPAFGPGDERPLGSLWYQWTAPATDLVRFGVDSPVDAPVAHLDVYRGGRVAALDHIARNRVRELVRVTSEGPVYRTVFTDAVFFAEEGETFRIRVAHGPGETSAPTVLRWRQGPRPDNDDFADAAVLEGPDGSIDGTNLGATLESGESFGSAASTTWYRWTAPGDGAWRFEVDSRHLLRVAAFTGSGVGGLRLVSGGPSSAATFKARSGGEYRIAVASRDANVSSGPYDLSWERAPSWSPPAGDDFATAGTITHSTGNVVRRFELTGHTVEPGEPEASGVRTRWYAWTAPETARFTWKLDSVYTELTVAAFAGDALGSLELVASTGADVTSREFTLDAEEGERYRISVGWPAGDVGAYVSSGASGRLRAGPTPRNDEFAGAIALGSTRGLTTAGNLNATTAPGELADQLGHSTLWWTYEAPTPGWYEFYTTGDEPALAVLEVGATGAMREIARDRDGRLVFRAETGRRYAIRASTPDSNSGGPMGLHWRPVAAPAWLRYLGSFAESEDAGGTAIELIDAADLAFDASGGALYAVSADGLTAFERDPDSGTLAVGKTIDDDIAGSLLIHDAQRDRVLADRCGVWRVYTGLGDADGIEGTDLAAEGDPANCGRRLFLAPEGGFLYRVVRDRGIDVFEVADGALTYRETAAVGGLRDAVIAPAGDYVYAAQLEFSRSRLRTLRREAESGSLTIQTRDYRSHFTDLDTLAIADGERLFATRLSTGFTGVFEASRGVLRRTGTASLLSEADLSAPLARPFEFSGARPGTDAVDVFAADVAVGIEVGQGEVDLLGNGQTDRFGNRLPLFGRPNGLAASPDGRHVYIASYQHGIVGFERVGAGVEPADPHVRLDILEVSPGSISFAAEKDSDGCIAVDDLDHDGVAYTVQSSKWQWRPNADWPWTDVAGTRATGEFCPHTPAEPGHYRLVAEVSVDGEARRHTSNTLIHDDHGDSIDDATSVGVPSATGGWLESGDQDYFRIELDQSGELTVHSAGWINAEGRLLDEDGDLIASDSDSDADYNFRIVRDLDAGTYFVRVHERFRRPGAYAVHIDFEAKTPDLAVEGASVDDAAPGPGASFTLNATVRNRGDAQAPATTLRYYRSTDSTISDADTEEGTDPIGVLEAGATSEQSVSLTAPSSAGTYYYGACADAVAHEADTGNNCSDGVEVTVSGSSGAPDLTVESAAVDDAAPDAGASFTFSATVRNRGGAQAAATTLRYYRSANSTISDADIEEGTDPVGVLATGATSAQSVSLTAPSSTGTYYYGACVDAGTDESDTGNNCSDGVEVVVADDGSGTGDDDHGDDIGSATSVSIPSTTDGELEESGDKDYFRLSVSEQTTLTVETTGRTDTYGTLFDADGSSLETDDDDGTGTNFEIEREVDAGTYYVEVRGFRSSTTGSYVLNVDDSADGTDTYCRDDDKIDPGDRCDIYNTTRHFEVETSGRGCLWGGLIICASTRISLRTSGLTFVASRNVDRSWTIDDVEPEPD